MTDHRPIPLLPFEKALAAELGVSEAAYQRFKAEVAARTRIDPAVPQAGAGALTFAINLVLGVGFTALGALFRPKPPGKPPTLVQKQTAGSTTSSSRRFAPRYGFGSTQEVANAGQRYPLVFAKREVAPDGRTYGGIRVNMLLLWSQMWSVNGSQLFRGIYLLGRRDMGAVRVTGFAFGDASLVPYDFGPEATKRSGRFSLYASTNGGRINTNDWIGGRDPYYDIANAQNFGGQDVFSYRGIDGAIQQDFCHVLKPSSGTQLGLYGFIPNGMAYRVAPQLRPTATYSIYTRNQGNDYYLEGEDDTAALADFWKSKYCWSTRGGLTRYKRNGNTRTPATGSAFVITDLNVDDLVTYTLSSSSDARTRIKMSESNTDNDNTDSETILDCLDVASAVASIQHEADESLIIGELYKLGSALAVLESTNPNGGFMSEADNQPPGNGVSVEYRFRVVRGGDAGFVGGDIINPPDTGETLVPPYYNRSDDIADQDAGERYQSATSFPQIMRCAIASFGVTRPTRLIEIGFKSSIGIRVNGLTSFRDCPKLMEVNARAGENRTGSVSDDTKVNTNAFQSGSTTRAERRFAFYRLEYRDGVDAPWLLFSDGVFGFGSSSGEAVYDYLRIQFPYESPNWFVRLEPLSGWQIRTGAGWGGDLIVLDSSSRLGSRTDENDGVVVSYNGYQIGETNPKKDFGLTTLEPKQDIGYNFTEGGAMIDAYGRLAEKFVYSELASSIDNGPEVEISYVNIFTRNAQVADYDDLALIGINVSAGTEISQLSQASQDVECGYITRRLLNGYTCGCSHLWPDLLWELMTNRDLGDGVYITDAQIDLPAFVAAAQWCQDRFYFYDAVMPEPVNLLEWAGDVGSTHLLKLVKRGAKFGLYPALTFGAPVEIKALFTAGNISENTFEMSLIPYEDRQPIAIVGIYRVQSPSAGGYQSGSFPQERSVLVREQQGPAFRPTEELDLSDYCTSERHLVDACAYEIRRRRLMDHAITFSTTPEGLTASLASGDYIQVAYDLVQYDKYAHGIITNSGKLVTTRPDLMQPGVHMCLTWDGSESSPIEQAVTVGANETAVPAGVMFAKKQVGSELKTYEITRLSIDREGRVQIEAIYHPCDEDGYSLLAKDWPTYETDASWEIRR